MRIRLHQAVSTVSSAFAITLTLLYPISSMAAQQTGSVAGTVAEASTLRPIAGAVITVTDARPGGLAHAGAGVLSDSDGRFLVEDIPAGPVVLRARLVGYSAMEVRLTVVAGQTTETTIELRRTVIALDAVVVTGTGGNFQRKQVGNTIATVEMPELETAPIATFSEILQGREPSLIGLTSGGLAGEGMRIRIRGSNSLAMSNEPVVYLDGIRIDNAGGLLGYGGGGMVSRLDDINPEAIERVEILKGAAAGTLYGSEASSGVIQIFTKQGRSGRPRFSFRMEQGISRYPDRVKPNAGFARTAGQADSMSTLYGMEIEPFQIVERTFLKDMYETGRYQSYGLDATGGGADVQYYVSGRLAAENGPLGVEQLGPASDSNRRLQATASLTLFPRERLSFRVAANYSDVRFETLNNNNNVNGPQGIAMLGKPELADCDASSLYPSQTFGETTPVCTGAGDPTGSPWGFLGRTPRAGAQVENRQNTGHFNGSITAAYDVTSNLSFTTTLGLDAVDEQASNLRPYGFNVDRMPAVDPYVGHRWVQTRNHRELTFDVKASWSKRLARNYSSEFVVGAQGFFADDYVLDGFGYGFGAPGLSVTQAGSVQESIEYILSKVNLGVLAQEQIGFFDVAYLTVGGRWDRNSTFGKNAGAAFYPKASISVIPTDISSWDSSLLSTLRIRAAYGRSGLQPGAFDRMTTYGPAALTSGPAILPENLGNPDLRPERSSEIELGAEMGLLDDRASVDVTFWDRSVTDALIAREFAAGGFLNRQMVNIGRLDGHGWEIKLDALVLDHSAASISLFANAAYLHEMITDMGGAPPIRVSGGYTRHRNTLAEGYAPGTFFGVQLIPVCAPDINRNCYTPGSTVPFDVNGDSLPDSESEFKQFLTSLESISLDDSRLRPLKDDVDADMIFDDHPLGKPTPDWQGAFGAEITLWRNLQINTLFEYRTGNYRVANLTDAFRRSMPALGRNVRETAEVEATLLDPATQTDAGARFDAAMKWGMGLLSLYPYQGLNLVEKADFVRWRELSVTYSPPASFARRFRLDDLAITFTARNLMLFTGYSGIDPESNQYGRCGGGGEADLECNFLDGVDVFGMPLPRRFAISIRFGF